MEEPVAEQRTDRAFDGEERDACARAVWRIFWGLLLVVFDFDKNGIDVLPDELGLLLLVFGIGRLSGYAGALFVAVLLYLVELVLQVAHWWGLPEGLATFLSVLGGAEWFCLLWGLGGFAALVQRPVLARGFRLLAVVLSLGCSLGPAIAVALRLSGGGVSAQVDLGAFGIVILVGFFACLVLVLVRLRQLRAWLRVG